MQDNPYLPPRSALAEAPLKPASRPFAVWLFLVMLLFIEALFLTGLFRILSAAWLNFAALSTYSGLLPMVFLRVVLPPVLVAILAWSVFRRKRWACWSGLLAIAALGAYCVFATDNKIYGTEAMQKGADFAQYILFPSLFAWWAYAFGFSAKAKTYFAKSGDADIRRENVSEVA